MITIADVKDEVNTRTYLKGRQLYQDDQILHLDYKDYKEDGYGQRKIKALVHGSGCNQYQVTISVDEEYHTIIESRCNCKAFSAYAGMCKHCVAVLLTYIDVRSNGGIKNKSQDIQVAYVQNQFDFKNTSHNHYMEDIQNVGDDNRLLGKTTTPKLKQLLEIKMVQDTLHYVQNEYVGQVQLIPYLEKQGDNFHLEFKIGMSHMYVLKDLQEFYRAFHTKEPYRYGQKLKFIHHKDMFTANSQKLLEFVLCQLNKIKMETPYQFGSVSKSKMRELFLSGESLEEFLEIIGEQGILANIDYDGEKVWHIKNSDIKRELDIVGEPLGIALQIKGRSSGYRGKTYCYYFEDGIIYKVSLEELMELEGFLTCVSQSNDRTLFVSKADIPLFVKELYPILKKYYTIEASRFDEKQYEVHSVSFEIYLDAIELHCITCEVKAVYGDCKYNVYDRTNHQAMRDLSKEMMVGEVVSSLCNAYDETRKLMTIVNDEEKLYYLLTEGIGRLHEIGTVYVSDGLKAMKVTAATGMSVGVSLSGELLELSLINGDMELESLIEIMSKYDKKKKFYRLRTGEFITIQGEALETLITLQDDLQISPSNWEDGKVLLPKYRALYLDAHLKEKHELSFTQNEDFQSLIHNMRTIDEQDFLLPQGLNAVLRGYQEVGFQWIKTLKKNGFGGILADDMGLGKTLQVIAFLLSEYEEASESEVRNTLIVTPASLVFNWNLEIQRFASILPVKMVVGSIEERHQIIKNMGKSDILITSYDLLKRDLTMYKECQFGYQIIDEAQYIKNHGTMVSKAVKEIKSSFRLALTGTPMENRLSELWSIFDYIMPGFLRSYGNFKETLEIPIVSDGDVAAMGRLHKLIHPFILRRLKKDVLTDLPDKLEEELFAKLTGEQQQLYDAHVHRMKEMLESKTDSQFKQSRIQILAELTKLRQICCNPSLLFEDYNGSSAKVDMCMDLLRMAVQSGHKVLLFSQFTTMLEQLQIKMVEEDISYYTLTGATNKEKRARLVQSFNQDNTSVFCISLKAGGTGLNLTSADIVIHFDPWWNVAVQNQATDRAHRIGQKNVVTVYKLLTKGTIEENIVKLQRKKTELAEQVLDGKMIAESSFTKEELLELLQA